MLSLHKFNKKNHIKKIAATVDRDSFYLLYQ